MQNLEQLSNDNADFRNSSDSLVNALVQRDTRFRIFMDGIKERMDEKGKILSDSGPDSEIQALIFMSGIERTKIDEDLFYIMMRKPNEALKQQPGSRECPQIKEFKPG